MKNIHHYEKFLIKYKPMRNREQILIEINTIISDNTILGDIAEVYPSITKFYWIPYYEYSPLIKVLKS